MMHGLRHIYEKHISDNTRVMPLECIIVHDNKDQVSPMILYLLY